MHLMNRFLSSFLFRLYFLETFENEHLKKAMKDHLKSTQDEYHGNYGSKYERNVEAETDTQRHREDSVVRNT